MIPDKIYWFMGYDILALILEQDRKHWLMKTDRQKQIQDKATGDMFQGYIDNLGSEVILQTEKLGIKNDIIQQIKYAVPGVDNILSIYNSAFAHSAEVNGLLFARITSIEFPLTVGNEVQYKNYKLKLTNCKKCILPFGGSVNSSDVYAGEWIYTKTKPTILMIDENGDYTIEKSLEFTSGTTGVTWYYPLTETMQPLNLTHVSDTTYLTEAVNTNGFIGYPLYWFTCDQSNLGPSITITNNETPTGEKIIFVSNPGNGSKYDPILYTGISGNLDGTPDGSSTSNYEIQVSPISGRAFSNTTSDFSIPLDGNTIKFVNTQTAQEYILPITWDSTQNNVLNMLTNSAWTYVNENTYKIPMSTFDGNTISSSSPLIGFIQVKLDKSIPFEKTTTDVGYSGIHMSASNQYSDIESRYPYDLNKWDGIPEWLNLTPENGVPQHGAIYAIHNTPTYTEDTPDSRQVAALIFDPGKMMDSDHEEFSNDERGRIYVLSNDKAEYTNNASAENPKPARTIARICDIPVSVAQLSGISGVAPVSVVDKQYVRSEASYRTVDKERLYNTIHDRWVRPIHEDKYGTRIIDGRYGESNEYVFSNPFIGLEAVDLYDHNAFRMMMNVNPVVDPTKVTLSAITEKGSGYQVNDLGVVYVGGFAFHYLVTEVDADGGVTNLTVIPTDETPINLSNFDMAFDDITVAYGTSPLPREGSEETGSHLRFSFRITNYEEIKTYYGDVFDDLYAFVTEADGLWLYQYAVESSSQGKWVRTVKISEYDTAVPNANGGITLRDSYINSIVPSYRSLPITQQLDSTDPVTIETMATPTFINIIDQVKSPLQPIKSTNFSESLDMNRVDLNKFYCDGIHHVNSRTPSGTPIMAKKNVDGVISVLKKQSTMRFDSYVFWKWDDPNDISNLGFTYGIITHGFNNLMSTDMITMLPKNDLRYKKFVHTNPSTTIVWDVKNFGVMVWMYDPYYTKHEAYRLNSDTLDLNIEKTDVSWDSIDIRTPKGAEKIRLVENGIMQYGIITNSITAGNSDVDENDPIYQQQELTSLVSPGQNVSSLNKAKLPQGNWRLVFPRVDSYKLTNLSTGITYTPTELQSIRNSGVVNPTVQNENGYPVNQKAILIDSTDDGVKLRIYNSITGTWDFI